MQTERCHIFSMVAFTALISWTVVLSPMATGIDSPFDALEMNLSEYQNPWPVINTTRVVYLERISEENATHRCVKSRYWGYEAYKRTVKRSLDLVSHNVSSINISLDVKYQQSVNGSNITMLEVTSEEKPELPFPAQNLPEFYSTGNRTFPVLFSDRYCLILGDALNETRFTNCSLWFLPKGIWLSPPVCCEFMFIILCGQGTKFDWDKKCDKNK
uniref:Lipocalin n=1 Tax=Rhipicephalus appendiculatus TaxID=34631 RepID=A0A131Z887_RHIAP